MVPISSSLRARGRIHAEQVGNPSQGNTETYRTRVPRENPRMHGENIQTPCRKTPGRTQDLIAARQQYYKLCHRAAQPNISGKYNFSHISVTPCNSKPMLYSYVT
ncbi:hypothetical protein AMECASPLE_035745 [Ameca splendens]|uniref:Uncharacterized protein n=1 Tax=Ameca splendens TaxID=208324 RepID=A0ABV1A2U6_9TELE